LVLGATGLVLKQIVEPMVVILLLVLLLLLAVAEVVLETVLHRAEIPMGQLEDLVVAQVCILLLVAQEQQVKAMLVEILVVLNMALVVAVQAELVLVILKVV
jgi:hypothetical protein